MPDVCFIHGGFVNFLFSAVFFAEIQEISKKFNFSQGKTLSHSIAMLYCPTNGHKD